MSRMLLNQFLILNSSFIIEENEQSTFSRPLRKKFT